MKVFAAITAVLLSLSVGIAFGSGVAEGDSQDGEHNLRQPRLRPDTYDCDDGCDLGRGLPVCGVDGNTYFTECLAVCQDVAIERGGACPGDGSMKVASRGKMRGRVLNMASFVGQGKVSKAEMFAHKDKKYKLIAKRTFSKMSLNETEPYEDISLPSGRENGGRVKGGRGAKRNQDTSSSLKLLIITADGLEYAAELSKDEIPEAVGQEGSGGRIPPPPLAIDEYEEEEEDSDGRRRLGLKQKPHAKRLLYPDTLIGQIEYKGEESFCDESNERHCLADGWCTGTIIGKNKILTAAHCLWDRKENRPKDVKQFIPGRTKSTGKNSRRWGAWKFDYMNFYPEYKIVHPIRKHEWDVGVITVKDNKNRHEIGDYMGYLGYDKQPSSFDKSRWSFTGYPSAPYTPEAPQTPFGTMWNTGKCDWRYDSSTDPLIYHTCESYVGMSGASIRKSNDDFGTGGSIVHGVHVASYCTLGGHPPPGCWNRGLAINSKHLSTIREWVNNEFRELP